MSHGNVIRSSNISDRNNVERISDFSQRARVHRPIDPKMVQNVLLIWLDNNIDDKSPDCRNTVTQLRRIVNTINTFTDGNQCIQLIKSINNDNACMIISGSLGQEIVPRVHDMSQVDSIFIFCGNKTFHEQWAKKWSKIKGVFTEITSICDALKKAVQQCEQNAIGISFMATSGDMFSKNLDQLDSSFMCTKTIKEILLSNKFEQGHMNEFVNYCRDVFADNQEELINVKEFERKYREKTPIWWYTCEGFLYSMLNRAVRLIDIEIIIRMGFFIQNVHHHIDQLHSNQLNEHQFDAKFIVYRGQGMSKATFQQMTKINDGLMSFDNFLLTNRDRNVSLPFARNALSNPDLVGILFVMNIDPSISTTPFASITDASCFQGEGEVLFSMHTVFRIRDIKPMGENNRLFQVDLILISDKDKDLDVLTDRIRKATEGATGWCRLGELLCKMSRFNKAEEVYKVLLAQSADESEKASLYSQLGWMKDNQGEYKEAITFFEKSLEIIQKRLPPHHPDLASYYNHMGIVYRKAGKYSEALLYYEKDLQISQKILPSNHPDLASSYNNIGIVYRNMGEYSKALSYYEKALQIRQQLFPSNKPDLASSYNNIGVVYYTMREYPKALSFYEKALAIRQQLIPLNHRDLAMSYNNIANVYTQMGEYSKALSYYDNELEINQKIFPPNHPNLDASYNDIGFVYENMGDYSKAVSFYERAMDNGQRQKNLDRVKKKL